MEKSPGGFRRGTTFETTALETRCVYKHDYVCGFAFPLILNGILPGKFPAMTAAARKAGAILFLHTNVVPAL